MAERGKTKFIFVTGGVVSSLGKGLSAASLGALLEARGLKVSFLKMDPYINVDPEPGSGEDPGRYPRAIERRPHAGRG